MVSEFCKTATMRSTTNYVTTQKGAEPVPGEALATVFVHGIRVRLIRREAARP